MASSQEFTRISQLSHHKQSIHAQLTTSRDTAGILMLAFMLPVLSAFRRMWQN